MNLQERINEASKLNSSVIDITKDEHHIDHDVYCFYHPELNPNFTKNPEAWGRIHLRGVTGGTSRNINSASANFHVSNLHFAKGKRFIVADHKLMGEAAGIDKTAAGGFMATGIAVSGDVDKPLVTIDGCPRTDIRGLNVYNKSGIAIYLNGVWESNFSNIFAAVGKGVPVAAHLNNENYAGGLVMLDQFTVDGGSMRIGDGKSKSTIGVVTLNHFQARRTNIGLDVRGGVRNLDLVNPWFEWISQACVSGQDNAFHGGRLYVRGGSWWMNWRSETSEGGHIALDNTDGDLVVDAWYPIEQPRLDNVSCTKNFDGNYFATGPVR